MIAALALLAFEPVKLEFVPDLGQKRNYSLKRTYRSEDLELILEDRLEFKVVQRDSTGHITLEIQMRPLSEKLDGETIPISPNAQPHKLQLVIDRQNAIVSYDDIADEDGVWVRTWRFLRVVFPTGDLAAVKKWKFDSDAEGTMPDFVGEYSLNKFEELKPGRRFARVGLSAFEWPMAEKMVATGSALVEMGQGWIESLECRVQRAPIPNSEEPPCELTALLTRVG